MKLFQWVRPRPRAHPPVEDVAASSIDDLEREEWRARREADGVLSRRIAAAECDRHGHVVPEDGPFADSVIVVWGSLTPIHVGPHCTRCGANLAAVGEPEGPSA